MGELSHLMDLLPRQIGIRGNDTEGCVETGSFRRGRMSEGFSRYPFFHRLCRIRKVEALLRSSRADKDSIGREIENIAKGIDHHKSTYNQSISASNAGSTKSTLHGSF